MDVNINEESLKDIVKVLSNLPNELESLKVTVLEAKREVEDALPGAHFTNYSHSIENCASDSEKLRKGILDSLGLLGHVKNFSTASTKKIYDSFHGVLNEAAWNFFNSLVEGIKGKGEDAIDEKSEDIFKPLNDEFESLLAQKFPKAAAWKENKEDKFKELAGDNYNSEYKYGKNFFFGTFDLWKKERGFSKEIWKKEDSVQGKYGSLEGTARVGAVDAGASISVGPDHVNLDLSASIDGFTGESAYKTPALTSKDGLEILSAGFGGEVSVLHAETSAKVGAGWNSKDKKFEAGVHLEAEADLAKAEVKGQTTVMGVTAEGSVGAKIGVGAQLDAGFVGDKLNFNLSLAAGIGFEVGFSLDFGNVTDYVTNKVKKYANAGFLKNIGKSK